MHTWSSIAIRCLSAPAGEAEYVDDQPALPGELHGHYVLSTIANAKIGNIDASKALVSTGTQEDSGCYEEARQVISKEN